MYILRSFFFSIPMMSQNQNTIRIKVIQLDSMLNRDPAVLALLPTPTVTGNAFFLTQPRGWNRPSRVKIPVGKGTMGKELW